MDNQEIINSWSLTSFCHANGNPKFANLENKTSGQRFNALMFNGGEKMVTFSDKICQRKEDTFEYVMNNIQKLNIIQLGSGSYKICKRSQASWQDMDII